MFMSTTWGAVRFASALLLLAGVAAVSAAEMDLNFADKPATWDELSRQVIPALIEKNWDMGYPVRYARKATCKVMVQFTLTAGGGPIPAQGAIDYQWEDGDENGALCPREIRTEHEPGELFGQEIAKGAASALTGATLTSLNNLFLWTNARTVRTPTGYQMTLQPVLHTMMHPGQTAGVDFVECTLTITSDYRITGLRKTTLASLGTAGGAVMVETPKCMLSGGRWLWVGVSRQLINSPTQHQEQVSYAYETVDGIVVLAQATGSSLTSYGGAFGAGGGRIATQSNFRFTDWKFDKRPQPLPPPTPAAAVQPDTPPLPGPVPIPQPPAPAPAPLPDPVPFPQLPGPVPAPPPGPAPVPPGPEPQPPGPAPQPPVGPNALPERRINPDAIPPPEPVPPPTPRVRPGPAPTPDPPKPAPRVNPAVIPPPEPAPQDEPRRPPAPPRRAPAKAPPKAPAEKDADPDA